MLLMEMWSDSTTFTLGNNTPEDIQLLAKVIKQTCEIKMPTDTERLNWIELGGGVDICMPDGRWESWHKSKWEKSTLREMIDECMEIKQEKKDAQSL
jgi:hypothetical protein